MENRSYEPAPACDSYQSVSQPARTQKAKFVFPLLRLRPLEVPEVPTEPLPVLSCSALQQTKIQSVQVLRLPSARAPTAMKQAHILYPLYMGRASSKAQERAEYTYVPVVHRDKEIGINEALLGCAILILIAIFIMMILYYIATY